MRSLEDGHARIRMFVLITIIVVGISWEVTCIHQRLRQLEVGELRIYQRMRSMRVVATLECDGCTQTLTLVDNVFKGRLGQCKLRYPQTVDRSLGTKFKEEL